jgi:hypothetical protein
MRDSDRLIYGKKGVNQTSGRQNRLSTQQSFQSDEAVLNSPQERRHCLRSGLARPLSFRTAGSVTGRKELFG